MIDAVEILLTKYDRRETTNPNEGNPVWERIMAREEAAKKEKAISRLFKITPIHIISATPHAA